MTAGTYLIPDLAADAVRQTPPLGLTASDGTKLRLVELTARTIVERPAAAK